MTAEKNKSAIRTEGLTKNFGSLRAVDALSIEARAGEIFGLLGPNGAGKTTTIKMICGLLRPDKGKIFINEKEAINSSRETMRKVGLCPQELVLWEYLTCSEQMMFVATMSGLSASVSRKNTKELLGKLNLEEKKNKTARTLSGGLRRRLNLALALVHDPEIIILDEPEAGLDPQSRVMVRDFIKSLAKKRTVVFTTHNMDEADRVCDQVGIIDKGKLLVADSPENLKKSVGEGDVLEITLKNERQASRLENKLKEKLGARLKDSACIGSRLVLRSLDTVKSLPLITSAISDDKAVLEDIRFRWNSLEDVFINLTGRSLRE